MRSIAAALGALAIVSGSAVAQGRVQLGTSGATFDWYWRSNEQVTAGKGGGAVTGFLAGGSATAFGPAVDLYCVDFMHSANNGTYDAYFTKLDGRLANTRSMGRSKYRKAAWLTLQLDDFDISTISGRKSRADIQAAIWWVMSGSPQQSYDGIGNVLAAGSYDGAGSRAWVFAAAANYGSINTSEWTVVTDRCVRDSGTNGDGINALDNCGQEFLVQNVVPEPATMILLGTGLLATLMMAGVMRRPDA